MKKLFTAVFIFLSAMLFFACHKAESLSVNLNYQATYKAADSSEIKADFYSLSDNSVYFVKVHIGDETLTLTRAVSASGECYVDEMQRTEFWTKGETAFIEELGQDGSGTGKRINMTETKVK